MIRIKKKYILLGVKFGALLIMMFSLLVFGYSYSVIQQLRLKIKESQIVKADIGHRESILEADTSIKREHLEGILTFTNDQKFIEKAIEDKSLEEAHKKSPSLINVIQELKLPNIRVNDCHELRCLQFRRAFSEIPSSIWKALLGTEDFRFLEHRGVDPVAIARAVVVDIMAMKFVQGGSTLTQQLMKNLFLTNERSLSRKLKELVFAIYIENIMLKEEIITLYLNEVFWGTFQGIQIKGYHAASLAYFQKLPRFLTEYESTLLVSLLKGPSYYRPSNKIERIKTRTQAVFKRLQSLSLVSQSIENVWTKKDWDDFQDLYNRNKEKRHFKIFYRISQNGEMALEPFEKYVFYDAVLEIRERLGGRTKDADIAIKTIIADKKCARFNCENIFSYYSKLEREKRASLTTEYHQVGSLFKPIVYDLFIEMGRSYDEMISTAPLTLNLTSGPWTPKDYSKAKIDTILLKHALQKSKNIPLVRVASEVGFDKLEKILVEKIPRLKIPLAQYPAQLLGAIELSLEEVSTIYGKFIQDKCNVIKENKIPLENTILHYMSVASETTISKLARAPLKNAYIFGKTGTSNNGLDNWYFAFDGKQVYIIWFGVESKRDEYDIRISGASSSFMIFQEFINYRGKQISEIHCE